MSECLVDLCSRNNNFMNFEFIGEVCAPYGSRYVRTAQGIWENGLVAFISVDILHRIQPSWMTWNECSLGLSTAGSSRGDTGRHDDCFLAWIMLNQSTYFKSKIVYRYFTVVLRLLKSCLLKVAMARLTNYPTLLIPPPPSPPLIKWLQCILSRHNPTKRWSCNE